MRTFWEYLNHHQPRKRGPVIPQADLVLRLIQQSGAEGISRGRLGSLVKLERETVEKLLDALERCGQSIVFRRGEVVMYRAG